MIEVEDVSKSFGVDGEQRLVLDKISVRAGKDEFVSIVGPSGCGKSTLLHIIAGLENVLLFLGTTLKNDLKRKTEFNIQLCKIISFQ